MSLVNEKVRVSRKDFLKHLERGGLPGVFFVYDQNERESLMNDWITVTCQRDLMQFHLEKNVRRIKFHMN